MRTPAMMDMTVPASMQSLISSNTAGATCGLTANIRYSDSAASSLLSLTAVTLFWRMIASFSGSGSDTAMRPGETMPALSMPPSTADAMLPAPMMPRVNFLSI